MIVIIKRENHTLRLNSKMKSFDGKDLSKFSVNSVVEVSDQKRPVI